jgi:hypothetical protein
MSAARVERPHVHAKPAPSGNGARPRSSFDGGAARTEMHEIPLRIGASPSAARPGRALEAIRPRIAARPSLGQAPGSWETAPPATRQISRVLQRVVPPATFTREEAAMLASALEGAMPDAEKALVENIDGVCRRLTATRLETARRLRDTLRTFANQADGGGVTADELVVIGDVLDCAMTYELAKSADGSTVGTLIVGVLLAGGLVYLLT